jgi:serine/threonine-protein kinase
LQETLPIQVEITEAHDDQLAQGLVVGFDPAAGTKVPRDAVVKMIVSLGHAPVAVPDVTGQTLEQATTNLKAAGFTVKRGEDGRSAAVDKGEVMAISPAPGAGPAPYGSEVTVTISVGVPLVTVPNVVGMSEDEANAALTAAKLKIDATKFFGNKVRQQQPAAGEIVEQGATVKVLVAF